jgi:hypothetical protein
MAGVALGLTLVKPQLVLPLGVAVIVAREWKVLAGWAASGVLLLAPTLVLNPHWPLDWLAQTRNTVAPVSREVDVAHFGVYLPGPSVAVLVALAVAVVVYLAWRRRGDLPAGAAILLAGGVVASPHALPADLVLVAVGLAIWGRASWSDWLLVSIAALVSALTPPPVPAVFGVLLAAWLLGRISLSRSPAPAPASPR